MRKLNSPNRYLRISWKDLFIFSFILGLKSGKTRPLDFFRAFEYPVAVNSTSLKSGTCILDVGSGSSILPSFLVSKGCNVYIVDIDKNAVKNQKTYARQFGKCHSQLFCVLGDITRLCFRDRSFHRILAISTLEHIRADGDSKAVEEIARTLKDEGIAAISIPFSSRGYRETETKSGYNKVYDISAIRNRLLKRSNLRSRIMYFQERMNFGDGWYRLPVMLRTLFFWVAPFISSASIRKTKHENIAAGAFVLLFKE